MTTETTREILERVYDEIEGIAQGEIDETAAANLHDALTRILAAIPLIEEV